MLVSEKALKWAIRFYPPLLFQRIWVQRIEKGFTGASVKISKSLLNINYNKTIFGGTIFSGADPFYPALYHQILLRKGYKTRIWVKSAEIDYIKPGRSNLFFSISVDNIEELCQTLNTDGKLITTNSIEIFDAEGQLCALVKNQVHIRHLKETYTKKGEFS